MPFPILLPNPDFLEWLLTVLAKARRSIVLVNYLATLGQERHGPVSRVAAALAAAVRRKVKVSIVLEGSKFRENMDFYRMMRAAGADIWMDTSLTFIHTKAVLVDDRVLCVGSHNLSAAALTSHNEMSAAFSDKEAVRRFHVEFEKITAQKRRIKEDSCSEGTRLPLSVISPLIRLKRRISPDAYLLYLLLCRLDKGRARPIKIDAQGWVEMLGLPQSTASAEVRIAAMLDLMDRKLGVVSVDNRRRTVRRISLPRCKERILVPVTFWKYGWHRRLSVAAIHLYLAGEAERLLSPYAPWWRLRRDEIAAKYGFQKQLVNRAQAELKRAGLLEILFETGMAPKGRYARYMNYFRQNPFYDREAFEAKMHELARGCKPQFFAAAGGLLHAVCDDSDLEKMAVICGLVSKQGLPAAKRVLKAILSLSPNSTKRTFGYECELLGDEDIGEDG